MASMDVFKGDGFSMDEMLTAIENADYKPQFLGSLNLFEATFPSTRVVTIESRDNTLELIQTTPIGAPLIQRGGDKRKLRNFNTVRLAKGSSIQAEQIENIRAFGSTTELQQIDMEVARRLQQLKNDMELTWEHHRLGGIQGIVLDADGSEIVNYYDEFDVVQPAEVPFPFATLTAGQLRPLIEASIVRPLIRAGKGNFLQSSRIVALVGDDFWDRFINHADVRTSYLNWEAAATLRDPTVFSTFRFAGVEWVNYRGTDDETTVGIATNEAKFFPVDAPGTFKVAWAPAEFMDTVNRPGVPLRPLVLPDPSGRNAFVDIEVYSYPLFVCTRPLMLRRGVTTS